MPPLGLDGWWDEPHYKQCYAPNLRGEFILVKLMQCDPKKFQTLVADTFHGGTVVRGPDRLRLAHHPGVDGRERVGPANVTGGLLAEPLAAEAQTAAKTLHVGILGSEPIAAFLYEMFKEGLAKLGYIEGNRVQIVQLDGGGVPARLPAGAAELVRARVDVIFARGPVAVAAAADASKTIPIVALDLARLSCIPKATRTARSASSSLTRGTPKTAMTASPAYFSTVPPKASICCDRRRER